MSNDIDPDSEDLDALLRDDAGRHGVSSNSLDTNSDSRPEVDASQPAPQTHIQRLLARSAHISSTLRQAFTSIRDTQYGVDIDRDSCARLSAEMDKWEQVLVELDKACGNLVVAAQDTPHRSVPEAQQDISETPEAHAALLAKIAAQDARIRELESRIKSLNISVDNNPAKSSADTPADNRAEDRPINRLIIAMTDQGNLKFPLQKQIITIGRSPQNDIHIRSRFISRYHARIVCDGHDAIIEDLDSSNGISVNSRRARRQSLRSGDLIDLGRTQLKYIDLSEGSSGEGQA